MQISGTHGGSRGSRDDLSRRFASAAPTAGGSAAAGVKAPRGRRKAADSRSCPLRTHGLHPPKTRCFGWCVPGRAGVLPAARNSVCRAAKRISMSRPTPTTGKEIIKVGREKDYSGEAPGDESGRVTQ